ncbi:MAG: metal ABC transporter permease [Alphaproteobacteria bacterium]|nr:metal ABC transporter permease [Alphaproteobacteria bacterium]
MLYDLLIAPFAEFAFMRRALVASLALAVGCGPVGVFLVLRRMSLVGDAMSHAVLPGAALGFVVAGLSLFWMSLGGFLAGLLVALLSGLVARLTTLREDASFAAFYLISLATGVLLVSTHGSNIDLMHVLFGTILAVDDAGLLLVATISSATLVVLALVYRPLIIECFDPGFLAAAGARGGFYHALFMVLVVMNLVAGFQALGTLMAVGMMMLPATAARFWAREVWPLCAIAVGIAFGSGAVGLLVSYHANLPSGPAIVLTAGVAYVASVLFGSNDSLLARRTPRVHLRA